MNCFFWHKWGKWSESISVLRTTYLRGDVIEKVVDGQRRCCDRCGKIEVREMGDK